MASHTPTVTKLATTINLGSLKERDKALDDLTHLLNPRNEAANLIDLGDSSYHKIFEAMFSFVLREKPNLYRKSKSQSSSNPSVSRLSKCAGAVRMAVGRGVTKLGRKTLLAITDHITQVLPGPDGEFVAPLLQDYVKALVELLARRAHVENLACQDARRWEACVEFFVDLTKRMLPQEGDTTPQNISRSSPALVSSGLRSSGKSALSTQSQRRAAPGEAGPLRDALEGLHHLTQGVNAPVLRHSREIVDVAVKVLGVKHLSLGPIQTLCFAILNTMFVSMQAESFEDANELVNDIVPLMAFWWRAEKVSQDELIRALRNEISKGILLTHLHLEHLSLSSDGGRIQDDIEELADRMWQEYSKRGENFRLQMGDICFDPPTLYCDHLRNSVFGLRPHNIEGESYWAIVQNIAFLESILLRSRHQSHSHTYGDDEQPRKKQRTRELSSRLKLRLRDKNAGIRRTGLQVIPFMLDNNALDDGETAELLGELATIAAGKDPISSSWALIACARCATVEGLCGAKIDTWRQIWHLAVRSISLLPTSRAACFLIHSVLVAGLLPHHGLSEDINNIVTTADVNGPAVLADTSISLMRQLFHIRNTRLPSASQSTCNHIIRWVFLKWNPSELAFSSFHSIHVHPSEFVNLLRACCGMPPLPSAGAVKTTGGALSETWKSQQQVEPFVRYILLLQPEIELPSLGPPAGCSLSPILADSASLYSSKKLIMELFASKLDDLKGLCLSWSKKSSEGGTQMSVERFQSLMSGVMIGAMLAPQFIGLNLTQCATLESDLIELAGKCLEIAASSVEPASFMSSALRLVQPLIPPLDTSGLSRFHAACPVLLRLLANISGILEQKGPTGASGGSYDAMDIDQEFESQGSRASLSDITPVPRRSIQLQVDSKSFYTDTTKRLSLLRTIQEDENQIGILPDHYVHNIISMSDEDVLNCQRLLIDIFRGDLTVSSVAILSVVKRLGDILSDLEYRCCEVALTACIEVMVGSINVWLEDTQHVAERIGDLYYHFIRVFLPSNIFSSQVQISMVRLLLALLRSDPDYGTKLGVDSCRTSLLSILRTSPMEVKYFIGQNIADVFGLYVLKLHDEVFVDVLDSLPKDPDNIAGIAFRLLLLSRLACRWPTLLRRCTYHIFETPGKIRHSTNYATRCLGDISGALGLQTPTELFLLFRRQLLYTWLATDSIEEIPYSIFGFGSLLDLLRSAQSEALGLMIMRGQSDSAAELARQLGVLEKELLYKNFSTAMAYSMIYGDAFGEPGKREGERYIEMTLGKKAMIEAKYVNFVDIVALFFDLIDQDNPIEKTFLKNRDLVYAGKIMQMIKGISCSTGELPPNQQPMFKARYLVHEIRRLCEGMEFEPRDLWTPALVSSTARKLLNTVHPALGSLHACSVLRKVRILVCLAGEAALDSYALELLLSAVRAFIADPECADDALGISQYLLSEGSQHLCQVPSFVSGYALSTLTSLRVFLESSQASTTQEEQFKATMSKAKRFHAWFSQYVAEYTSPLFKGSDQTESFRSIMESAAHVRSFGNAERSTPESKLLLGILMDGASDSQLLNQSSRDLALGLLCSNFAFPSRALDDAVESDEDAIQIACEVWKSCATSNLSDSYLSWAGRVVGRSFSASGGIPKGILQETQLPEYKRIASDFSGSEIGLLRLLQELTLNPESAVAGLAEAALRRAVSEAISQEDEPLIVDSQQTLGESLFLSSQWGIHHSPPSDNEGIPSLEHGGTIWTEELSSPSWLPRLTTHLASSAPDSIILSVLPPVLARVSGFAQKAFPFLVHLVLHLEIGHDESFKGLLSNAMKHWLNASEPGAKDNLRLLLNMVLYLRNQKYPKEMSIADREYWLDIDHAQVADAACRCGMYKTAHLFVELAVSESQGASQRASTEREVDINSTLLTIFENIDDPDAYYGLPEDATLAKVLSRVEYENEGMKSLAFRGAQYDSHLRHRDKASEKDAQSLVKALNTLGLSGLSHSLLQAQQNIGSNPSSVASTFQTAQKLEMWNMPAPVESDHPAVVLYKTFQSMYQAPDTSLVRSTIYEGFQRTMQRLAGQDLNATAIRERLCTLASLTELDDLVHASDTTEIQSILNRFKSRDEWMKRGRYDDVSQILSSRGTTMSMLSQHSHLIHNAQVAVGNMREAQIQSLLMSARTYRYYQATQESMNLATTLMDLIPECEEHGLAVDAAIKVEVANSLWDHGEMGTSIRMLQAIDQDSSPRNQTIPVSRSDLLSKIGHQVSVARLEKPQDIQKKYLEPALRELRGASVGEEAGMVYHQFALFCDGQLQDPAGLEDLARLQNLRKGKSDEVAELQSLISSTRDTQLRARYNNVLSKEKQWLSLDEEELRRVEQTRNEFVRLSLENYLLALIASDEHNSDALRFIALWLERSAEEPTSKAVAKHIGKVPTRKFATLMNQLTSRLQGSDTLFQKLLMELVYTVCVDHPYHGMYQIWSGTKARAQEKDEMAIQRVRATEKVAQRLSATRSVADRWLSIDKTSKYYHLLAMDRNETKYKSGLKIYLKDSTAANNLVNCVMTYQIPPPTMDIELSSTKDYSGITTIAKFEPQMTIASGVSAPKIITAVGSDGIRYKQLVKGGHDDLRQDAIMEQVFAAVSSLLKLHRTTQQRNLGIRTYKVLPLTASSGLIEFVPNTIPLHDFLMPAHERYYPRDLKESLCRREIFSVRKRSNETRINTYRRVTGRFHPVMRYFFMEYFVDPDEWFAKRLAYTRSTAAISMLGHVLGLGDRHGHNILLDTKTGEVVHIDLGVAFEAGRILPVPELVPFRLTRDIVDGMGITKTEGVFRRCCEFTLDALRDEQYSIMTILDVLRYDPLYTWSISPLRQAKLQRARQSDEGALDDAEQTEAEDNKGRKAGGELNEPSEADRALEVVRKKLSKSLSVKATVNDLINQAMDECNLAVLYSGWAAYA